MEEIDFIYTSHAQKDTGILFPCNFLKISVDELQYKNSVINMSILFSEYLVLKAT